MEIQYIRMKESPAEAQNQKTGITIQALRLHSGYRITALCLMQAKSRVQVARPPFFNPFLKMHS